MNSELKKTEKILNKRNRKKNFSVAEARPLRRVQPGQRSRHQVRPVHARRPHREHPHVAARSRGTRLSSLTLSLSLSLSIRGRDFVGHHSPKERSEGGGNVLLPRNGRHIFEDFLLYWSSFVTTMERHPRNKSLNPSEAWLPVVSSPQKKNACTNGPNVH